MDSSMVMVIKTPRISFNEKNGWNGLLSKFDFNPVGLLDPVWCKNNKWTMTKATIKKGNKKWNVKNRVKVGLSIANPPQTHWTKNVPKYGIADRRFVITVAPQKDICPHGRTYPTKAVNIVSSKMITPIFQVFISLNELK